MSWLHCALAVLGHLNQTAKPGSTAHHSLSCCFPLSPGHACGRATVGRHVAHAVAHAVARLLAQPVRGPSSCHTSSRFSSSWLACVLSSVTKGTGYLACHSPHQNQRLGGTRPTQAPGCPTRVQCRSCARGPLVLPCFRTVLSSRLSALQHRRDKQPLRALLKQLPRVRKVELIWQILAMDHS